MRVWTSFAAACALAIGAGGVAIAKDEAAPAVKSITQMSPAELEKVRTAGAQILFWSDAQRAANFRAMEAQFPGTTAQHGTPRALPKGEPLAITDAEVEAFMAAQNVAGLMVIQDGKVRLEKYGLGMKPEDRWTSFSVAKSFTSTLVGAAVKDGFIASIDDPVTKYVPELKGSGYDGVTVKQILTMTSGVKWNEDYTDPNSDVVKMLSVPVGPGEDPNTAYLKTLPREAEPGTKWVYKTGETNLIGVIVQRATGKTLTEYAQEKIVKPAGFEGDLFWMVDSAGQNVGGCCLSIRLADYARMGLFALEGGKGQVPDGWFAEAGKEQAPIGLPGFGYGYQWWTYPGGAWGGQGIFGQAILIVPQKNLVVAVVSNWPKASGGDLRVPQLQFFQKLAMAAN
ncbi:MULTISPECIES: serine hydrolase domain-containing protein [Pseudomonadota]|jgi:CubicO group peptidase (beta-lactamase class C family)|uniref:serine hydrolase domain-containing protein n=3 Tax=Pseudomonadota TaxID=1224 RepID=UPI000ADCDB9A|nr:MULTISPECIES: serine hydrolase domain-containing protein [Pseudomonadota]MAF62813.1 serine hydrolase [Blastomonas sp.]MBA4781568.1 beta-lactamase family protein [Blastomonas sp.]|tara:strand:+ start:42854 stop:44044 length:1191 start_codon:yes stop_codon:yes gene_type:complete